VGDHVRLQNQVGNHPRRWDRTGVVIEVCRYHQYVVRVDVSGRITIRNCRFLRKYTPVFQPDRRKSILDDLKYLPTNSVDPPSPTPTTIDGGELTPGTGVPSHPDDSSTPRVPLPPSASEHHPPGSSGPSLQPLVVNPNVSPLPMSSPQPSCPETSTQPPIEPDVSPVKLRRSTRVRRPPKWQTSDDFILY